jgi:hypothetical protein
LKYVDLFRRLLWMLFLVPGFFTLPAVADPRAALPQVASPLAAALNPDGTLRPGASGSFDARQFRLETAPDGRPRFRPAQTSGGGDERWLAGFGLPNGSTSEVLAVLHTGTDLYVAGRFTAIGNTAARGVARWDGTSWSALGTGINGEVYSLAVGPGGAVYAGGTFTEAGGSSAANVARWDGSRWSALGAGLRSGIAPTTRVYALAVDAGGSLYAGGTFNESGSMSDLNNVARWDGSRWNRMGTLAANGTNSNVWALAFGPSGTLYVGGQFTQAGGSNASRIATWNGTSWAALGAGIGSGGTDVVEALAFTPAGDLFVGGSFTRAGSLTANSIARWNGTAWSALIAAPATGQGNGVNDEVKALLAGPAGEIYAAGRFTRAGLTNTNHVARWSGTAWSTLGTGVGPTLSEPINALQLSSSGELYAGGLFQLAGSVNVENLARWNGSAWNPMPGTTTARGLNGSAFAVAIAPNGDAYVGGIFTYAGGVAANAIARWNGTSWSALGAGITIVTPRVGIGYVRALAFAPNGDLYVGGSFNRAGSVAAAGVARWNGSTWSALGSGVGGPSIPFVEALAVAPGGDVYVGGNFTNAGGTAANYVARWNGSSWSALGSGVNGVAEDFALAPTGEVYVAGSFSTAGGAAANAVARWNGSSWSSLGLGLHYPGGAAGRAFDIVLAPGGVIYAAGEFSQAGGLPASRVARWDGSRWSALGAGVGSATSALDGAYKMVLAANGDLYVGGSFDLAGGSPAPNIARWDGSSWSPLGTSLNDAVMDLTQDANGRLYAAGYFTATGDGSKAVCSYGIYDPALALASTRATAAAAAQLYPNPTRATVTLQLGADLPRQPLSLHDAQGHLVRSYPAPAGRSVSLDLRGLPAGTYLLQLGELTRRVVLE